LAIDKLAFMQKQIQFIFNTSEITAGTRGASLGPGAILTAARQKNDSFFYPYPTKKIDDVNDFLNQVPEFKEAKHIGGLKSVIESLVSTVDETLKSGRFPYILAGDHGSAAGTMLALKKFSPNKKLGVVWIDAHGDLHTPYTTPSGNMHGMPLAIALNEDNLECQRNKLSDALVQQWNDLKNMAQPRPLEPENLLFVGVRDTEKEEDYLIEKYGIRNITVEEFRADQSKKWKKEIDDLLNRVDALYVSFDVDSMDPDETSYGTGTPVKGGLYPAEVEELLIYLCQSEKLVCVEVVEVNPCLDNKLNSMAEITFDIIKKTVQAIEK
jgi:arginase